MNHYKRGILSRLITSLLLSVLGISMFSIYVNFIYETTFERALYYTLRGVVILMFTHFPPVYFLFYQVSSLLLFRSNKRLHFFQSPIFTYSCICLNIIMFLYYSNYVIRRDVLVKDRHTYIIYTFIFIFLLNLYAKYLGKEK